MKSATRLFYLAIFAIWAAPAACDSNECTISPKAIVDDACASYATLDRLNTAVKPALDDLTRTTDFFSHYRLNLFNKQCPFWDDNDGMCSNIGCAVETLDNEEDIPEVWRVRELSKLEGPLAKHPGQSGRRQAGHPSRPLSGGLGEGVGESCVFEYDDECDDRDYCVPEDESAGTKGDYVSLLRNPERFTGYGGDSAHHVWDAIYRENCFQSSSSHHSPSSSDISPGGAAEHDFRLVLDAASQQERLTRPNDPSAGIDMGANDQCLERRVFYRVISGMHTSISVHLCWDYFNQTTGEWHPNLSCYASRLHPYPDRISNLYFNYALLTRAIAKLGPYLQSPDYAFCIDDPAEDKATRAKVLEVTSRAAEAPAVFDETLMFANGEGPSLKEDFRNRFRNVSRIMDCVGCDKCRLWGKVQTAGYGTALKVLFEFDNAKPNDNESIPALKRTELVALFNTYARTSESLRSVDKFRNMLADAGSADEASSTANDAEEPLEDFIKPRRKPPRGAPVKDVFDYEMYMFTKAIKLILRSWVRFPLTLWEIISSESIRFYQFWLGLPVSRRTWRFQLPNVERDEL